MLNPGQLIASHFPLWKRGTKGDLQSYEGGFAVVIEPQTLKIPLNPPLQRGKSHIEIPYQTNSANFNKLLGQEDATAPEFDHAAADVNGSERRDRKAEGAGAADRLALLDEESTGRATTVLHPATEVRSGRASRKHGRKHGRDLKPQQFVEIRSAKS